MTSPAIVTRGARSAISAPASSSPPPSSGRASSSSRPSWARRWASACCGSSSLGCVLKVFVQIQLARTAVATGRTTLDELNALPGPRWRVSWILWLWLAMYVSLVFQVSGIVGGIAGRLRRAWHRRRTAGLGVAGRRVVRAAAGQRPLQRRRARLDVDGGGLHRVGRRLGRRAAVHGLSHHGVATVERPAVHAARQLHRRLCGLRRDRRRRLGADLLPVLVPGKGLRASRRARRRHGRLGARAPAAGCA